MKKLLLVLLLTVSFAKACVFCFDTEIKRNGTRVSVVQQQVGCTCHCTKKRDNAGRCLECSHKVIEGFKKTKN